LLEAALALFARQGVAASSLQAVASEAGVTPAMLHYYFGSRDQLLDVLVTERLLPLLADILQQASGADGVGDPRRFVQATVPLVMNSAAANPWLPPLWVREVLTDGGVLRARVLQHTRSFVPLLAARFRQAQEDGRLNPRLDPRLLLVSLIGLTLFPFAAAPIWRSVLDAGDITTDTMIDHTLALLERGLELPA
jgi:AcrR family transcriptional regulator